MTTIIHTTRTTEDGTTLYAVLCNGQPLCADTGDKPGTLALAERSFNLADRPARLATWTAGTGAEPVTIKEK